MADEQQGSRGGKSYGSHGPGSRSGKGFKPRSGGGKSYGHGGGHGYGGKSGASFGGGRSGGYHKGGSWRDGEGHGSSRDGGSAEGRRSSYGHDGHSVHGDNPRYRHDDRRGGYQGRADRREGGERGGYQGHGGPRRDFHRDGESSGYQGRTDRHDDRRGGYQRREGQGGGFHRDGERRDFRSDDRRDGGRGGYQGHGGPRRDFHKDGEHGGYHKDGQRSGYQGRGPRHDFHKDGERSGYQGRGDHREGGYQGRDGGRGGFHRGGERRDFHRDDRRDGDRRYFRRDDRRDGERSGGYQGHGGPRRDFHKDGESSGYQGRGGERRDFHRDGDRGDFRRDNRRGGDRRDFHRDDRRDGERSGGYQGHDGSRRDYHRDGESSGYQGRGGERRDFHRDDRRSQGREDQPHERLHEPRLNSDGTMSFPSQNPYTDRRPGEPKMPKGMEWSMLSKEEKERLRGLSKEHAENTGLHILAAYYLEESDPEAALAHAKWVAKQASRIDFSRETLAFMAYRQGDYKLALREFRTAQRMNGYQDYMPFIADCERGLGNPKKAIEIASSEESKYLDGESKAEMFLVYAGALGDLGLWDKAIEVVHQLGTSKGLPGAYRMRALQAEQNFLDEAGRGTEAADLDPVLDKLEAKYAEIDEDDEEAANIVIDYDLEELPDELMERIGVSEEDAAYAPESEDGHDDTSGAADDEAGDATDSPEPDEAAGPGEGLGEDRVAEESAMQVSNEADPLESSGATVAQKESQMNEHDDQNEDILPHTPDLASGQDPSDLLTAESAQASVEQDADGYQAVDTVSDTTQPLPAQGLGTTAVASAEDENELPAAEVEGGLDESNDPAQVQERLDATAAADGEESSIA
nr:helicase [Bifidobacterium aemilianum]